MLRYRAAMGHLGPDLAPAPQWGLPRSVGPAGLICSSAADVVTFAGMHLQPSPLLSDVSVRTMQERQVDIPGPDGGHLPQHQALGWMFSHLGGVKVLGHDGGTIGQSARLRFVPSTGTAVALLSNGGDFLALAALVDEILHELTGAVVPPALEPREAASGPDLQRWAGRYARKNQSLDVRVQGGGLLAHHEMSMGGVIPMSFTTELLPYEPADGMFLTRLPEAGDAWVSVTFLDVPGSGPVAHLGGRATPLVSA